MAKEYVVITKSGRVTIPEHIRHKLRIIPNQLLKVSVRNGEIVLENAPFFGFDKEDIKKLRTWKKRTGKDFDWRDAAREAARKPTRKS